MHLGPFTYVEEQDGTSGSQFLCVSALATVVSEAAKARSITMSLLLSAFVTLPCK